MCTHVSALVTKLEIARILQIWNLLKQIPGTLFVLFLRQWAAQIFFRCKWFLRLVYKIPFDIPELLSTDNQVCLGGRHFSTDNDPTLKAFIHVSRLRFIYTHDQMSALYAYKAWCSNLCSHELQPFHLRHKITCEMVDVYFCIDPVLMLRSFEKRSAWKNRHRLLLKTGLKCNVLNIQKMNLKIPIGEQTYCSFKPVQKVFGFSEV